MQIAVGRLPGPEGPRAGPAERARHVDVVFGTHNVGPRRRPAATRPAAGRIIEILEETALEDGACSPPPCRCGARSATAAWVTIQIGCDNCCAFCIVPSVRGAERSKPFGEVVDEVERPGRRRA